MTIDDHLSRENLARDLVAARGAIRDLQDALDAREERIANLEAALEREKALRQGLTEDTGG